MIINTFLIGIQKSGTTTFWNWLSQHPNVFGPEVMKDYHFFSRKEFRDKGISHLHAFYNGYKGESIVLQGGVNYYFEPEFIDHVLDYQPDGKFLIILRNPVDRAWSAYQYFTKLGQEDRSFDQAILDEIQGNILHQERHRYAYLEHGLYAKYLQKLIDRIPSNRIFIMDFHELIENPEPELHRAFNFLGIDPDFNVDATITKNKTGQVRFALLNKLLFYKKGLIGQVKKHIPVQKLMPLSWRIRMGNRIRDVNVRPDSEKPQLPEKQRIFLEEYFSEDQVKLKNLLRKEWRIEVVDKMILNLKGGQN